MQSDSHFGFRKMPLDVPALENRVQLAGRQRVQIESWRNE
jgi:hypothetical protein